MDNRQIERLDRVKYLILNGSPNKNGNTWKLVQQAKAFMLAEEPEASFREIHLIDEGLPFCLGCSACFRLGHEKCPHSAVMMKLIRAVEEADGVIVASAAYNMRETALLKNLFDHLCFMLHRPCFFSSKALILTTTGGVGGRAAAKSIASFLYGIGFNRCSIFSAAALSWNDYRITEKSRAKLKRVAGAFREDVASRRLHSPSTLVLIPYNLFRGMSIHYAKGAEYQTQDGVFWLEERRKRGVYDAAVPVPFFKRPVGHLFYLIGKFAGAKVTVTYKKRTPE
jgi:multimeric flavodoxin WrbA